MKTLKQSDLNYLILVKSANDNDGWCNDDLSLFILRPARLKLREKRAIIESLRNGLLFYWMRNNIEIISNPVASSVIEYTTKMFMEHPPEKYINTKYEDT